MGANLALHGWATTNPAPNRLWPVEHPALANHDFVVIPSQVGDRTTLQIPAGSILRPILQKERVQMDEAYMLLEHVIQKGSSTSALDNIQFQLAHCLRNEHFLVTDTDPNKGLKDDRFGLRKAMWAKEEDLLHRRRYLELSFHALV